MPEHGGRLPFKVRFGFTAVVTSTIGAIITVSVGIVLFLSLGAAEKNTYSGFRTQAKIVSHYLEEVVGGRLKSAWRKADHIGDEIVAGRLEPDNLDELGRYLTGTMAGADGLSALMFIRSDMSGMQVIDQNNRLIHRRINLYGQNQHQVAMAQARKHKSSFWGKIIGLSGGLTVINVQRPVWREEKFLGVVVAALRIKRFSRDVAKATAGIGGEAFVLYDDKYVLAHRLLRQGFARSTENQPLPTIKELGDPVLIALESPIQRERGFAKYFEGKTGIQIVFTDENTGYPVILQEIPGLRGLPIKAGVYFLDSEGQTVIRRLLVALIAGLAILLAGIVFAFFATKRLTKPLRRFAVSAHKVRQFNFTEVPDLPASRIREVDEVSHAFNAMVRGLRWMDAYVPHQIVQRLMHLGRDADVSELRDVTIMFTDIANFTERSHAWSAPETAKFLNQHFAILAREIEREGGIVDKYMGDGLMAFWGAPDDMPDHAARACRAAQAIREAIEADNRSGQADGVAAVQVRLGLHSGPAVIGNIGISGRLNFTAVGDTVNLASRLEQYLKDRGTGLAGSDVAIVASKTTIEASGFADMAAPGGETTLRGTSDKLEVYFLNRNADGIPPE